jgi:dipeptidyl-peptidase-4
MNTMRVVLVPAALLAIAASSLCAQKIYTDHDYAQAERWMGYNEVKLVHHTIGGIEYLPDGRVFYRDPAPEGLRYYLADPAKRTKELAFDLMKLAAALNAVPKTSVTAEHLSVSEYKVETDGFAFSMRGQTYHCDAALTKCRVDAPLPEPVEKAAAVPVATTGNAKAKPVVVTPPLAMARPAGRKSRQEGVPINLSPDKSMGIFIRDWNLWLRVMATGNERQLTADGVADFGYGTDNAGWQHSDATVATWSKDGKKIATFQQDQRKTGMMYLVPVTNSHPKLEAWRYPLVGDKDVTMIEPVVIDVASGGVMRLKVAPLEHRSMECDDVSCDGDGRWNDVEFSSDDARLAFVATGRDHKDEWVKVADTSTGDVRDVYHEHVDTYYGWQAKTDWKVLWGSNEFLWVSERSNFAQIYLYDLATGKLKNQVTRGDGPVYQIPYVDEKARVVFFTATGKQPGVDPYFEQLYSVGFDGKRQALLTPEVAEHEITAALDGSSFVDVYSTAVQPKVAVLRDREGNVLETLLTQDISGLLASGWKPSMPIAVKARDGKTKLYGFLERPTDFDPAKKYPVVDYVYPGPQDGSCGGPEARAFASARGDHQALAELGFVVVCIDGMGNPHRSKAFHDAHASTPEEMGDDTIPDQIAGIKDLASQYSWVDATRVGIWGHSGGGNATVSAMFHFPEFFKVGWAESGNHDNRDYEDDWDERWAGLQTSNDQGVSNYEVSANQSYAAKLQGKLMLVHGTMDDNVPQNNTLLVVDALMKANKDFDMLMVPNAHHGYGEMSMYIMRRRWDYFVGNLAGGVPPEEYKVKSYAEVVRALYGDQ